MSVHYHYSSYLCLREQSDVYRMFLNYLLSPTGHDREAWATLNVFVCLSGYRTCSGRIFEYINVFLLIFGVEVVRKSYCFKLYFFTPVSFLLCQLEYMFYDFKISYIRIPLFCSCKFFLYCFK